VGVKEENNLSSYRKLYSDHKISFSIIARRYYLTQHDNNLAFSQDQVSYMMTRGSVGFHFETWIINLVESRYTAGTLPGPNLYLSLCLCRPLPQVSWQWQQTAAPCCNLYRQPSGPPNDDFRRFFSIFFTSQLPCSPLLHCIFTSVPPRPLSPLFLCLSSSPGLNQTQPNMTK